MDPQTLEEGVAQLATVLDDRDLSAAVEGKYGPEIRLLAIGEKARRATSQRVAS